MGDAMKRLPIVDVLRGLAVVAMVVYHFAWFANEGGLVDLPVRRSIGWHVFQRSIASTFFVLVGVSLHLSCGRGVRWRPFARRLARVLGGAAVVTGVSLMLDPRRAVVFGILHSIAACSVLVLPVLGLPSVAVVGLGLAWVALAQVGGLATFDTPWLHWTGLSPQVPPTFDLQPLFPWMGVVMLGVVVARWLETQAWAAAPVTAPVPRVLAMVGRHSLLFYMGHVPVLVGIVALLLTLR